MYQGPLFGAVPPGALELVTSPWCGIDVLTCKVRLKKRVRERIIERKWGWGGGREREVSLLPTSIISRIRHDMKVAWDMSPLSRLNHGMAAVLHKVVADGCF